MHGEATGPQRFSVQSEVATREKERQRLGNLSQRVWWFVLEFHVAASRRGRSGTSRASGDGNENHLRQVASERCWQLFYDFFIFSPQMIWNCLGLGFLESMYRILLALTRN